MKALYWIVYSFGILACLARLAWGLLGFAMQGVGTVTAADERFMARTPWFLIALVAWIALGPVLWRWVR